MLELRNVSKTVGGVDHIRDVSLKLEHASLNVLLGPTLSGKTSLMRLMAGLDQPTSGSIWFDGKDVTGVPVQKRNVAMVYQQFINSPAASSSVQRLPGRSARMQAWCCSTSRSPISTTSCGKSCARSCRKSSPKR